MCDLEPLWSSLTAEQIEPWQALLQPWSGKSEELRRNLPVIDTLAQFREAELEPFRQTAVEMRANCDDIILTGSTQLLNVARMIELFDAPPGRGPRIHIPRGKDWDSRLLPALEGIGSRVGVVVLGWNPGELNWERSVPSSVQWMQARYDGPELHRRLVGISSRPLPALLDVDLRYLAITQRSAQLPMYTGMGLFPLFLAGFEASSLIEGARSQIRALEKSWNIHHPMVRWAILRQVLVFQEGWSEVIVTPDRFLEPLGLWAQHRMGHSFLHLDPPLPFPFPHLQAQEQPYWESELEGSPQLVEVLLDYGGAQELSRQAMDRGRPAFWLGLPRLDMYTLGGCLAFLSTAVAFNLRWLNLELPPLEIEA